MEQVHGGSSTPQAVAGSTCLCRCRFGSADCKDPLQQFLRWLKQIVSARERGGFIVVDDEEETK